MYQLSTSNISNIDQLDGNISIESISENCPKKQRWKKCKNVAQPRVNNKSDKISTAVNLPVVATYNCRSLFPKLECFKTDMIERNIDCAYLTEVWEQSENKWHSSEVKKNASNGWFEVYFYL